ncbi:MAG TPA: sigma-70 family RNA polymerase sigma factor [Thermoanaerobaculia bacterium]|nr:sigma-70 family RNA polymerase sigma factor [Thermoanaerobaculia bacterium]
MSTHDTGRPPERAPDEADLLRRILAGDREAAERLAESTYRRLFAFLFKCCGDRDRASDLTQETFRKAWGALRGFDGRSSLSTWLHRIAYTTFLNSIRGPRRLDPLDSDAPRLADPSPTADERIGRSEEDRAIRRAVLTLPEDLRFTITAHFWGEMPVREIAAVEGITTVAVRKRLAKALRLLEGRLSEVPS